MPDGTTPIRLRIRDLLASKTLITSCSPRELVIFHEENHSWRCEWLWQYEHCPGYWVDVPKYVLRKWWLRRQAELVERMVASA